jgi:hypothetical protein
MGVTQTGSITVLTWGEQCEWMFVRVGVTRKEIKTRGVIGRRDCEPTRKDLHNVVVGEGRMKQRLSQLDNTAIRPDQESEAIQVGGLASRARRRCSLPTDLLHLLKTSKLATKL